MPRGQLISGARSPAGAESLEAGGAGGVDRLRSGHPGSDIIKSITAKAIENWLDIIFRRAFQASLFY